MKTAPLRLFLVLWGCGALPFDLPAQETVVHPDRRVTFRLQASDVRSVQIDIKGRTADANGGKPFDMTKSDDGTWSFTSAPLDPGFHYYFLFVDGFRFADSANPLYFGWGRPTNGIEIPDPEFDGHLPRDVPRGEIRIRPYFSRLTCSWREVRVYTPPGYEDDPDATYPVLYLQHGAGENETSWSRQGRAGIILDNLIADGKCVPMLVVMEDGYAHPPEERRPGGGRGTNLFERLLVEETVPMIEAQYRATADRNHRAIAGLSMGGGQALRIAFANLDTFSHLGCFSAAARNPGDLAARAEPINEALAVFWIGCGTEDFVHDRSLALHRALEEAGIRHEFVSHPGTHEWQAWRLHLSRFAPKLFR